MKTKTQAELTIKEAEEILKELWLEDVKKKYPEDEAELTVKIIVPEKE